MWVNGNREDMINNWYKKEKAIMRKAEEFSEFMNGQKVTPEEIFRAINPEDKSGIKYLSAWISPDREIYIVDDAAHADFIDRYYQKEILKLKKIKGFVGIFPMRYAYKNGWVRVVIHPQMYKFYVSGTKDGISRNYDTLKNIEDVTGFRFETSIRDISGDAVLWESNREKEEKEEKEESEDTEAKSTSRVIISMSNNSLDMDELIQKIKVNTDKISGWITSSGDIYEIPSWKHLEFIYSQFKEEIDRAREDMSFHGTYQFAYDKGWIRFYAYGNEVTINCSLGSYNRNMDKLKYLEEMVGTRINVNIEEIHTGIGVSEEREEKEIESRSNNWYKVAKRDGIEIVEGNQVSIEDFSKKVLDNIPSEKNGYMTDKISGWVTDDGEIYIIPSWSHIGFIYGQFKPEIDRFMQKYNLINGDLDIYSFAFSKGWIKFYIEGDDLSFKGTTDSFNKNKHILDQIENITGQKVYFEFSKAASYAFCNNWYKVAASNSSYGVLLPIDQLKEKADTNDFSGWLSPNGDIYEVPEMGHEDFIREKFQDEMHKPNNPYRKIWDSGDMYVLAWVMGWVRIWGYFGYIHAEGSSKGIRSSYANLKNIEEVTGYKLDIEVNKAADPYEKLSAKLGGKLDGINQTQRNKPKMNSPISQVEQTSVNELGIESQTSGWLSSDGSFYKVDHFNHGKFLRKMFGKAVEKITDEYELYKYAYNRNWVRIVSYGVHSGNPFRNDTIEVQGTREGIKRGFDFIKQLEESTGSRVEYIYE